MTAVADRSLEREYIRDAIGQFADIPGVGNDAIPVDKLKLASRIDLKPGETLRGSGFVKLRDSYNGNAVAMAHIDTPHGRQVRLGIVDQGDLRKWSGRDRGATVQLDERGIADLESGVAGLGDKAKKARADAADLMRRVEPTNGKWVLTNDSTLTHDSDLTPEQLRDINLLNQKTGDAWEEGVLASGPWGDLVWRIMPDLEADSPREVTAPVHIGVRPPGAPDDWYLDVYGGQGMVLQERDIPKFQAKLAELLGTSRAAEAYDTGAFLSRSLEAFRVISDSPAVQLMMYARVLEMAADSFMRRGKLVHVERGRGGKFARKGVADAIGDAVGAMADAFKGNDSSGGSPADRAMDALHRAGARDGTTMGIEELRAAMGGTRAEQDAVLNQLNDERRINLMPQSNQKILTDERRSAALRRGNEDKALVMLGSQAGPAPAKAPAPKADANAVRADIVAAQQRLAPKSGGWVSLADLREELGHHDRADVDAALIDMATKPGVHLIPWDNTKALRQRDHDAALRFGGDDNHVLRIEQPDALAPKAPETSAQKRKRADSLLSDMPSDQEGRDRVHTEVGGLILDADRMDAAAKPSRSRVKKAPADTAAIADRIRNLPHKPESREKLAAELDGLGAAEMRAVADAWNIPLPKRTTKAQSRKAIEDRLGFLIDHDSILNGGWDTERQQASQGEGGSYFAQFKAGFAAANERDRERRQAEKSAPTAGGGSDMQQMADRLKALPATGGREEAEAAVANLKLPQLRELAKQIGPTVSTKGSAATLRNNIVEGSVGFRERAQATGGWRRGFDFADNAKPDVSVPAPKTRTQRSRAIKATQSDQDWMKRMQATGGHEDIWGAVHAQREGRPEGVANQVAEPKPAQAKAKAPRDTGNTLAARKVMGTQMSLPMQQALVKVEDSGGLEMRRAEFINDYKLSEKEFDRLVDDGFLEVDEQAGMGFIGVTPRGLKALEELMRTR